MCLYERWSKSNSWPLSITTGVNELRKACQNMSGLQIESPGHALLPTQSQYVGRSKCNGYSSLIATDLIPETLKAEKKITTNNSGFQI